METQTRLSRHDKFISEENITILSVSSDDYLHISLVAEQQMWSYSSYSDDRIKELKILKKDLKYKKNKINK